MCVYIVCVKINVLLLKLFMIKFLKYFLKYIIIIAYYLKKIEKQWIIKYFYYL